MKKVLFVAMLLSLAAFSSCSSSDDNQEEQQQPTAENIIVGRWKMTSVTDFPLPVNQYSLISNNYITFTDKGVMFHEGDFSVVINGNQSKAMTLPFATYAKWSAESTSDTKSIVVYLGASNDQYVGYVMSSSKIDLVKFSDDKIHGISYRLEKK